MFITHLLLSHIYHFLFPLQITNRGLTAFVREVTKLQVLKCDIWVTIESTNRKCGNTNQHYSGWNHRNKFQYTGTIHTQYLNMIAEW